MTPPFFKEVQLKNGTHVVLRDVAEGDVVALQKFINAIVAEEAEILMNVQCSLKEERAYVRNFLLSVEKRNAIKIVVVSGETIVGTVDVNRKPYKQQHVGLVGICLSKEFRGIGLGTILMQEIIERARTELGLRMLELTVHQPNAVAQALYTKVGFLPCGHIPESILHKGTYVDQVIMYKKLDHS